MVEMSEIKRVAEKIATAANAEKVILFGSFARGDFHTGSDVDLFIIAPSDLPRFKRSRKLYKLFSPYPFSMDLLVYTPEEVEAGKKTPLSFVSTVLREGKVVYDHRT